ncbi:hypothetical protein NL676_036061 [Syzygium grande]|nr:hypothetical protein NL676_036061 [Syzygium grande]
MLFLLVAVAVARMSDSTNFQSPDSADMDFNDQSDFELSEFLKIDEWLGDDPASMVHGVPTNSNFYQSNEVDYSIGSISNPDGHSGRKYPFFPTAHLVLSFGYRLDASVQGSYACRKSLSLSEVC